MSAALRRMILKKTGPEFLQMFHLFSQSVHSDYSNSENAAAGKVINWSGPATAIGGLLLSADPSHRVSFLLDAIIAIASSKVTGLNKNFACMALTIFNTIYSNQCCFQQVCILAPDI